LLYGTHRVIIKSVSVYGYLTDALFSYFDVKNTINK